MHDVQAPGNSAPLALQDDDVANNDAALKTLQDKGINNTIQRAMQAGTPASAAAPVVRLPTYATLSM